MFTDSRTRYESLSGPSYFVSTQDILYLPFYLTLGSQVTPNPEPPEQLLLLLTAAGCTATRSIGTNGGSYLYSAIESFRDRKGAFVEDGG